MAQFVRRPYQQAAISSIFDYFNQGGTGNPLVLMPTATGKSVVIGGFVQDVLYSWPRQRIVCATHVKELVEQNAKKLSAMWPGVPYGICSAGLKRWETHFPITFGGIDTLINYVAELGHVDLLLVDECHLIGEKDDATYLRFINALKTKNPKLKVIGFTATGWRQGLGMLTNGKIFSDVAVDMTTLEWFNWFVDNRYLSRLIVPSQSIEMDLNGIASVNGDFKQSEVETRAMRITNDALDSCMRYRYDRRRWISFASGVEHAIYVHDYLMRQGIRSGVIHSDTKTRKMSAGQRDDTIEAYRAGELQHLSNFGVLTTGFDVPDLDLIIMLRATKVSSLWVQMLGRGMRTAWDEGKENCLVLDFGQNCRRLGPVNDPVIPKQKGNRAGEVPIKICDNCGCQNHISARFCDGCGAPFEIETKYRATAGKEEVFVTEPKDLIERFEVARVYYSKHISRNKGMPHFKVSYVTRDNRFINEFIHIEAQGGARKKAADWWALRCATPCPATIDEALQEVSNLSVPSHIRVNTSGDYPKVIAYEYAEYA